MKLILYPYQKKIIRAETTCSVSAHQKGNAVFCHQNSVANPLYLV